MDSSLTRPWLIGASLLVIAISALVLRFLKLHYFTPASIARNLRRQGLYVLPYYPFAGNASEIGHHREQYRLTDLDSPSNHNIAPRIHSFYAKCFRRSAGRPVVFWWSLQPRLVVTNPEHVKQILSLDFKNYRKTDIFHRVFHRLFGDGLLSADGEDWQNQRTVLRPAFFSEKIKAMVADMHLSALRMTKTWGEIVKESGRELAEVEVAHHLKNATADILARTCFGSEYETGKKVFEKQVLLADLIIKNAVAHTLIPGYKFLPVPFNFRCWKIESSIDKELSRVIESRLKSHVEEGSVTLTHGTDLLGLILAGEEDTTKSNARPLTAQQIISECKTFFFAGHETTANLLAWTMLLLALYPEWQERVRAEVLEIRGTETTEPPQADNLNKMRLLGMVLNEALRLYPPVPELTPRVSALEDNAIQLGDLQFPRSMGFSIPVLYIHRDKELWGGDADEFRPERFQDGISKACKHPFGFLPFSAGPRVCIGQSFAIMEAKVIMAAILQRFKFRLSPMYMHAPESAITMRPRHGMQIILECL